jgi:cell division protein FtsB
MNKLKSSQKEPPKKSFINRRLKAYLAYFAIAIVLAAIGYLAYFAWLSPVEKLNFLNDTYNPKPYPANTIDYRLDTALFRIKKEEAFLKSKVALLANDSIYLVIDLKDSLLSIEIQGVAMHRVKIVRMSKSGIFNGMEGTALVNQFSSPFKIDSMFATIPKDPYILKIAPEDTIQAQKNVSIPDTVRAEPVIFSTYLNRGILLQISQSEEDKSRSSLKYLMKKRFERTMKFVKSAINFKVPEYQPFITIEIPSKDARAIYRALPRNGFIAIRLE